MARSAGVDRWMQRFKSASRGSLGMRMINRSRGKSLRHGLGWCGGRYGRCGCVRCCGGAMCFDGISDQRAGRSRQSREGQDGCLCHRRDDAWGERGGYSRHLLEGCSNERGNVRRISIA